MEWQQIKLIHFNQDVEKIINESTCDNCGEKEDLSFSESTATVLCEICKGMMKRICENRNNRLIKMVKIQRGLS